MNLQIDSKNVLRRLEKIREADVDMLVKESAAFISTDLRARFKKEREPSGARWAYLTPKTIEDKEDLGYGNQPILVRTGRLRDSVRSSKVKEAVYQVASEEVDYAEVHQLGSRKKNIPARPFIGISKDGIRGVKGLIDEFVRKILYT